MAYTYYWDSEPTLKKCYDNYNVLKFEVKKIKNGYLIDDTYFKTRKQVLRYIEKQLEKK